MLNKLLFSIFLILTSLLNAQSVFDNDDLMPFDGLFKYHYLESKDKIYLEVNELDSTFLYVSSLSQGIGNNDLSLDRGQLGGEHVVKFIKTGNKLLLIKPNLKFRALTNNNLEKKSVEEAFAKSVLFGFPILEKTTNGYIIDLTPFLMQDTHGVGEVLKKAKQGNYKLDPSKSALNMDRTKGFPENVEFDVLLTLSGSPSGNMIKTVTPAPRFVTVFQHHSFVLLPDNKFKPRENHPRSGSFSTSFMDYSSPINASMQVNLINRHRLEKKDPNAVSSEAIEPIIYYLDNGTPEPIRSALMEGAGWWNEAFEEIGFKNAFQVKILPDSIDPLDVRYNVIQWVHRSTRGWSYGGAVTDPRTGEIIKGHVSLGSLRVRQDFLIAQALSKDPFKDGKDDSQKMQEFALARIRQLGAHEVGHTLGFNHNYAGSTNNRSSVMDYPFPLVTIEDNAIDFSDAYAVGIGDWDKATIAYSYSQFEKNEKAELLKIIEDARNRGLRYVSDADSRPAGSANVHGHLWDNGANSTQGLIDAIEVRQAAINQFGINNIKAEDSYEKLEDIFVLIYFYHRYQTEAAIKTIGGLDYGYGLKNELSTPTNPVSAEAQRKALETVLQTADLEFLAIPRNKLVLFPARMNRGRESFKAFTGSAFDPINAAVSSYDHLLGLLLNPQRGNRLINQKGLAKDQLSFGEVLNALMNQHLYDSTEDEYHQGVQVALQDVLLERMMQLAHSSLVLPQVKSISNGKLMEYLEHLKNLKKANVYQAEHIRKIEMYFKSPKIPTLVSSPKMPDGSPIGTGNCTHR